MASSDASLKGNARGESFSSGYCDANAGSGVSRSASEAPKGYSTVSGSGKVDPETALYTELWRACAGPLVTVPRQDERVFYFPQGHIEQVEASTNQVSDQEMPVYDLPSKILCRVIHVQLKAEPDTDEVFAQVTLLPLKEDENDVEKEPAPPPQPRFLVHSFCKTLTASDTSTHGRLKLLCLGFKVRWDETSSIPRPDRVSPWKIEPALTPPALNPLPVSRLKRPRSCFGPSSPDSSVLTREGRAPTWIAESVTIDPLPASGFTRVLQGQELSTLRGTFAESNESDSTEKPVLWPHSLDDEKTDVLSAPQRYGSEKWLPVRPESTFTDLLSGFGTQSNSPHEFSIPSVDQTSGSISSMKVNLPDQEGKFSFLPNNWSAIPSGLSLNLFESSRKPPVHRSDISYQTRDARYVGFSEYSLLAYQKADHQQGNWLMPPPLASSLQMPAHSRESMPRPVLVQQHEVLKPKDGNCKIFGIPLNSNPVPLETPVSNKSATSPAGHTDLVPHSQHSRACDSDQSSEQMKCVKVPDHPLTSEHGKPPQTCRPHTRDCPGKVHCGSTRSCTKVHKQGIALGRSVDLTKFNNYEELIVELDQLFEFNGELKARNKNWMIVYTDDEGDMMLVGDDPWP
ncbi:hypothetical protein U1Q18_048638 [Sarracenia purpurea var. burkii]